VPIPIFIFYELINRIHQINPSAGNYVSHSFNTSGAVIQTTAGTVRIRTGILNKQFKDPNLVKETDLLKILEVSNVPNS